MAGLDEVDASGSSPDTGAMVPDVTETSVMDSRRPLSEHWEEAKKEIAAQYRIMGLLAGIGPDHEVQAARAAVVEALRDFFVMDIRAERDRLRQELDADRQRIAREYPEIANDGVLDRYDPNTTGQGGAFWESEGDGLGSQPTDYVDGLRQNGSFAGPFGIWDATTASAHDAAQARRTAFFDDLRALGEKMEAWDQAQRLAYDQQIENIISFFTDMWDRLRDYYNARMEEIRAGYVGYALGRVAIDAFVTFHLDILVGAIVAVVTAGTGAVVLAVSRRVFAQAVQMAVTAQRITRHLPDSAASVQFNVRFTRVLRGADGNGSPTPDAQLHTQRVVVPDDLTADERRVLSQSQQGTRADTDVDHGSEGLESDVGTDGDQTPEPETPNEGIEPTNRDARTGMRTREELLPNDRVPSVRNGAFDRWWNDLSHDELEMLLNDNTPLASRTDGSTPGDVIGERIRQPGRLHEWLPVGSQLDLKRLGFTMEEIRLDRPRTTETGGVNPTWRHGETGSPEAHAEIREILATSQTRADALRRLNTWADYRLVGGRAELPPHLQVP